MRRRRESRAPSAPMGPVQQKARGRKSFSRKCRAKAIKREVSAEPFWHRTPDVQAHNGKRQIQRHDHVLRVDTAARCDDCRHSRTHPDSETSSSILTQRFAEPLATWKRQFDYVLCRGKKLASRQHGSLRWQIACFAVRRTTIDRVVLVRAAQVGLAGPPCNVTPRRIIL